MSKNKSQVVVYGASWCGYCHAITDWLKQQNVTHTYKDIEDDEPAKQELLDKMDGEFRGIPVTIIGDDIVLGFDRPTLDSLLEEHGIKS